MRGAPRPLRCDNGGELVARALQECLAQAGIRIRFTEPGSPWQNGVNESFTCRFRDECLNRESLGSVLEAQAIARAFRKESNTKRPHSSFGYQVLAEHRALLLGQAPVRLAKPGLPSVQRLPARPNLPTTLNPTHDPTRLSPEVVQNRELKQPRPLFAMGHGFSWWIPRDKFALVCRSLMRRTEGPFFYDLSSKSSAFLGIAARTCHSVRRPSFTTRGCAFKGDAGEGGGGIGGQGSGDF